MSWRIKSKDSGNFVSDIIQNYSEATKFLESLNSSAGRAKYELVDMDLIKEKLTDNLRPMTLNEKRAISRLAEGLRFNPMTKHEEFSSSLIEQLKTQNLKITDKQAAYLWYIIYYYRAQIENKELVTIAKEKKVY